MFPRRRHQDGQAQAQAAASRPPRCTATRPPSRPFAPRQICRRGQQAARARSQSQAKAEIMAEAGGVMALI